MLSAASLISTQFFLNERRGLDTYCVERCGVNNYVFIFKLSVAALTATVLSAASLISTQFILNECRGLEFYCVERCGLNFLIFQYTQRRGFHNVWNGL